MPTDSNFFKERQEAIERMRDMARRSSDFGIPAPPFVKGRNNPPRPHEPVKPPRENLRGEEKDKGFLSDILSRFNLSFSGEEGDSDITLILALMLLFLDQKGDRLLLYALIYILL